MAPTPLAISETELEVLKILWESGPGTVREVREQLRNERRKWAYTTVQTLLTRLVQKGYVRSSADGRAHVFEPAITREQFLGEQLDDLAERVCEGTRLPLVLSLVQSLARGRRFSQDEIRSFREALDEMEESATSKKRRRRSEPDAPDHGAR
jgi:predicted transcriptional regulator